MKNVYLFQPSFPTVFDDSVSYWLPYTAGCIWSYAELNPTIKKNFVLADLIFKRVKIEKLLKNMEDPVLAGFSCYVWNWQYVKAAAKAIKGKWPNCKIVFGGPQVPENPIEKGFFDENPYVDIVVSGEGERAFEDILLKINNNEKIDRVVKLARVGELCFPSPYLSGVFDKIINDNPQYSWQATIESNRGCPYQCTFCDWGSLTLSKIKKFPIDRVLSDVKWQSDHRIDYMFFADSNFGIFYERDKEIARYVNELQVTTGFPKVAMAQWAKNAKHQVLDVAKVFFSNNKNRGFTVSVQSLDDNVLTEIKRKNMDMSNLAEMMNECRKLGITPYTELILGLPYETHASWKQNYDKILAAGQHNTIDVWFAEIIENAELNNPKQWEKHEFETTAITARFSGAIDEESDILETRNVIKSTKYMSSDELIQSYMFSYVISNYHSVGKTQIISRFLNKHKNLSYSDFYSHLIDALENGTSIMSMEYHRIKRMLVEFLNSTEPIDEAFHHLMWLSLVPLYENRQEVDKELKLIFDQSYCGLNVDLYDEVFKLQSVFNYEYSDTAQYPYALSLKYNLEEYIFTDETELDRPAVVQVSYPLKFNHYDNFKEKIYFGRRSGVLRTNITTIKTFPDRNVLNTTMTTV